MNLPPIQAPMELFEDLPEELPLEEAMMTWSAGVADAMHDLTPRAFGDEHAYLQPYYDAGYGRGARAHRIMRVLEEHPNAGEGLSRYEERETDSQASKGTLGTFALVAGMLGALVGVLVSLALVVSTNFP